MSSQWGVCHRPTCHTSLSFLSVMKYKPGLSEQLQVGEGGLDDHGEVVPLIPAAVDELLDLLHVAVQQAGHLVPGEGPPSKPAIQAGTHPPVGQVTERMLVKHVLNTGVDELTSMYRVNTNVMVMSINGTKLMKVFGRLSRSKSRARAILIMYGLKIRYQQFPRRTFLSLKVKTRNVWRWSGGVPASQCPAEN